MTKQEVLAKQQFLASIPVFFETIEDACVHKFYSNDEAVYRIGTVLYGH